MRKEFTRQELYYYYAKELNDYGADYDELDAYIDCDEYQWCLDFEWCDITDSNGLLIGFVVFGINGDATEHPDCDYFIAQTYMARPYRKQGLMKNFLKEYFEKHPGKYCLYILEKNYPAKNFWKCVENECGLKPLVLDELPFYYPNKEDSAVLYGFETKKES